MQLHEMRYIKRAGVAGIALRAELFTGAKRHLYIWRLLVGGTLWKKNITLNITKIFKITSLANAMF